MFLLSTGKKVFPDVFLFRKFVEEPTIKQSLSRSSSDTLLSDEIESTEGLFLNAETNKFNYKNV